MPEFYFIKKKENILKYVRSILNKLNQSNYDKLNYDLTIYLSNYIENENVQINISDQLILAVMINK